MVVLLQVKEGKHTWIVLFLIRLQMLLKKLAQMFLFFSFHQHLLLTRLWKLLTVELKLSFVS